MKKYLFFLTLLMILPAMLHAACSGSSPNLTAASGSYADVKACIDIATYGDTVNIPAADGSATDWTQQITITKNIRIVGAGIDVTKITSRITNEGNVGMSVFNFVPDSTARNNVKDGASGIYEITGLTLTGYATSIPNNLAAFGIYNPETPVVTRIRIHHNKVVNMWSLLGGGNGAGTGTNLGYAGGCIDNNQVVNCNQLYYTGMVNEVSVFLTDYRVYPGDGKGLYVEDNIVTFDWETANISHGWFVGANNSGMAAVLRYNVFSGLVNNAGSTIYVDSHSNQIGIVGGQLIEAYGNNWTLTDKTYGYISQGIYMRGQKNIYLYNILNNSNNTFHIVEEYNDHFSADPLPTGICTSRTNEEGTKQICPGYYVGTPDSCFCWKVHDTYLLNNRLSNGNLASITKGSDQYHENNNLTNNPPEVDENKEYFNHVSLATFQSTPTQGVTCGTYAEMQAISPTETGTNCSTQQNAGCNVGFWVPSNPTTMPCTSVSADNIKQTFNVAPVTPISGTLYKWNGTSWEEYWSPYTYPHPLRGQGKKIAGGSISGGSF